MSNEKVQNKVNEVSHEADDKVEFLAGKYNLPKWLVWVIVAVIFVGGIQLVRLLW